MTKDSEPMPALQEPVIAMVPSSISSIAKMTRHNSFAAPPHGVPLSDISNSEKRSLSCSGNAKGAVEKKLDESTGVEPSGTLSSTCVANDDWNKNVGAMRRRSLCRLSRKRKPAETPGSLDEVKEGNRIITIDPEKNKENEGNEWLLATPPPKRKQKTEDNKPRTTLTQTEEDEIVSEIILALPPYELVRWGTSRQLLPPPSYQRASSLATQVMSPNDVDKHSKLTLVLDLDETLVHSTMMNDIHDTPDTIIKLNLQGTDFNVFTWKRPGVDVFLAAVGQLYEVVVFTASEKEYADQAIDMLDPSGKLIHHRLYRESCIMLKGNYVKDISDLGRDISRVVIVDNNPAAFGYHLDNGVPISSWFSDTEDCSLQALIPLLDSLSAATDVRPIIRYMFNLKDTVYRFTRD